MFSLLVHTSSFRAGCPTVRTFFGLPISQSDSSPRFEKNCRFIPLCESQIHVRSTNVSSIAASKLHPSRTMAGVEATMKFNFRGCRASIWTLWYASVSKVNCRDTNNRALLPKVWHSCFPETELAQNTAPPHVSDVLKSSRISGGSRSTFFSSQQSVGIGHTSPAKCRMPKQEPANFEAIMCLFSACSLITLADKGLICGLRHKGHLIKNVEHT